MCFTCLCGRTPQAWKRWMDNRDCAEGERERSGQRMMTYGKEVHRHRAYYMHSYMDTHRDMHALMHKHTYTWAHMLKHTYTHGHTCTHRHVHKCAHKHIHTVMNTCKHRHVHKDMHRCTQRCTCARTHMLRHVHIYRQT